MRSLAWALFIFASLASTSRHEPAQRVIEVSTADELSQVLRQAMDNVTIRLAPGQYDLTIDAEADSFGVKISGRGVRLTGTDPENTTIVAHSALVSFKDCVNCVVDHVGIAVPDGLGSIVVRNSSLQISDCVIRAQVVGTSGTLLTIERNELAGIKLFDDAHGLVRNNVFEGHAHADLGVEIRDSAQAVVERNLLRGSGGILIRDSADALVRANLVEQMSSLGIACASHDGRLRVTVESNVIYDCRGPGILIDVIYTNLSKDRAGRVVDNIVVATRGGTSFGAGPAAILRRHSSVDGFVVRGNTCYDNVAPADSFDKDVSREAFWRARRPWTRTYRNTPIGVDGRHKFYESAFLTRYGRWAD